jgi:phenylpropionate dioxygenase-like ring-hydroxylating dioxygenase large terminal subunit
MPDHGWVTTKISAARKRRFPGRIWTGLRAGWARTIRAGDIAPGREPAALMAAGWVPVARSCEVGRNVLVRRLVQGDRDCTVLLWRTRADHPVAMDAMCPHRFISMADARIRGDALECPLHRRLFGPTGACINRPDTAPARTITICEAADRVWLQL